MEVLLQKRLSKEVSPKHRFLIQEAESLLSLLDSFKVLNTHLEVPAQGVDFSPQSCGFL